MKSLLRHGYLVQTKNMVMYRFKVGVESKVLSQTNPYEKVWHGTGNLPLSLFDERLRFVNNDKSHDVYRIFDEKLEIVWERDEEIEEITDVLDELEELKDKFKVKSKDLDDLIDAYHNKYSKDVNINWDRYHNLFR